MKLCSKVCACGQAFKTKHRAGRHCSPACKEKSYRDKLEQVYQKKKAATETFDRSCVDCGVPFTTKHTTKATCSKGCSNRLRQRLDLERYYRDTAYRFAQNARRRAAQRNQTPAWSQSQEIEELYREAKMKGMHVDHIVPINHPLVSGLHVVANLQLLPPIDNLKKGNRHWPDMP